MNAWLERQYDREANGENFIERQLWPRGPKYREGWNLAWAVALNVHHWCLSVEFEKDVNDFEAGFGIGPLFFGIHGFKGKR